ncbi:hypothetical protein KEM48_004298 [Puccinia striiformis f. sp. tritici PST-130]|nr:hypothetical protein KEM48_004298 [Puccinia striiformis f. sp. tritici PST-130]
MRRPAQADRPHTVTSNRGHAPVESISAPAGGDVLSSVLRKGSILGSMMSSNLGRAAIDLHIDFGRTSIPGRLELRTNNRAQIDDNRTQINVNQADID